MTTPSVEITNQRAPFGARFALSVMLGFAGVALALSLIMLAVEPKPLPFGVLGQQRQDAETLAYLVAFALILPLAAIAGPRLADAISAGPNREALPLLAALLSSTLAAAVLVARLSDAFSWDGGVKFLLATVGLWAIAATTAFVRATRNRAWPALLKHRGLTRFAWGASAALVFGTLLACTDLGSISPLVFGVGVVVIAVVVVIAAHNRVPPLTRGWGVAAEVLVVVLLAGAIPDLVIFRPEDAATSAQSAFDTYIIQFHHNFLLGPANQVLGGDAMLVDTVSQYGVGMVDFLAGWFKLAPIGYGTYGFLDGVLTVSFWLAGYAVLRIAGTSRPIAVSALAAGVIFLIYNLVYSVGALPQQGPLRFGLPMAVILFMALGERWPRGSRATQAGALIVVGMSSIWSAEAFAYTLVVFAAIVCFQACLRSKGMRLRWLGTQALLAIAACLTAHAVFAIATLAGTGQLPDWGQYLAYVRAFVFGDLADFTYDFTYWSPGVLVAGVYFASAIALILILRGERELARVERVVLVALAGTTAYGIVLFSYFVQRSLLLVLPYVGLPALLTAALWLGLLLRSRAAIPRAVRLGGLTCALSATLLLVAVASSSVGARLERSALGHVLPGGDSLSGALDRLWHPPPLNAGAPDGELLLDRSMPGERSSLVITEPDLGIEILLRSGRINRLPLGNPAEDSYVPLQRLPGLEEAVAGLEPGDRLLLDRAAVKALDAIRRNPSLDPFGQVLTPPGELASLHIWALEAIDQRFELRVVDRGNGFAVVALGPR